MMKIKDFVGIEINRGDKVIYYTKTMRTELKFGIISSFCVDCNGEYNGWLNIISENNRDIQRYCKEVVKIK